MTNIDKETVEAFGDEWSRFDQSALLPQELETLFDSYFNIFPWQSLPTAAEGFDMGCGSGRWACLMAKRVEKLNCIDPSPLALEVAKKNLSGVRNVAFFNASVSDAPLPEGSQDFGYSLGVLHHIPDTAAGLEKCVQMLKPGAPFLLYLYYKFDNRPLWYGWIWKASDLLRRVICRMPAILKSRITDIIALFVYLPLARSAALAEKAGFTVDGWVLGSYRNTSFYTMRTDSRDRFGTPLELRFSRKEIHEMMRHAGLTDIRFSDRFPFWCAVGLKRDAGGFAE